jgi:F-type H+-transporting ATPase subunit a
MKNPKLWGTILVLVIIGGGIKYLWPDPFRIGPSVAPEPVFAIGSYAVSNSILVSWFVMLLLFVLTFLATRNLSLVPGTVQNLLELAVETVMNLVQQTTGGNEKLTRWFFPFVATFLLFIVTANLLGLIPGFGPIGVVHQEDEKHPVSAEELSKKGIIQLFELPAIFTVPGKLHVPARVEEHASAAEPKVEFFPFFRAPSADFNMTLAFALISWIMTQSYGIINLGPLKFLSKYIVLGKIMKGQIGMGLLDFVVGILEAISEVSKIISLSFRLFGNIFAGEVLLLVMFVLFPLLPLPFYFLELMVGVIQAFVFAVLTLVFMTQATTAPHGAEEHH